MYQPNVTSADSARLEDYLRAIRLRKWVVIGLAIAGLLAMLALASSRTATYTATSSVVLGPTPVGSIDARLVNPNLEKERELLLSNRTAEDAAVILDEEEPLGLLASLNVAFRPDSDVISVDYTSTDAERSADVANAFATAYVDRREGAAASYYQVAIDTSQTQLDAINIELAALELAEDNLLIQRRDIITDELAGPERDASIASIDASLSETRSAMGTLRGQARTFENEVRADSSTVATRSPSAEVLRSASPPGTPDGLSSNLFGLAGLLLGLVLGVVTAFVLDRLDTTARDDEDVALALGTKVIGSIPTLGLAHRSGPATLVMLSTGGNARLAAAREAFRRLRSSVQFLRSESGLHTIVVTSASPSEGKSVTSANLAISLAQSGARVALVSADLRRPTQEQLFGVTPDGPGLSDYLGRGDDLNAIDLTEIPNLWFVHAGPSPSNPGELLGSPRFEALVAELESEVDFAIIDTPPILSTADALAAARFVDGVVIVVDTRRTETTELLQVRADLERSGARILGAVMNRRRFQRGGLLNRRKYSYYRTERSPKESIVVSDKAA